MSEPASVSVLLLVKTIVAAIAQPTPVKPPALLLNLAPTAITVATGHASIFYRMVATVPPAISVAAGTVQPQANVQLPAVYVKPVYKTTC